MTTHESGTTQPAPSENLVQLVGRVSAQPESRELPSGDELVTFRLIVTRPPSRRAGAGSGPPSTSSTSPVGACAPGALPHGSRRT